MIAAMRALLLLAMLGACRGTPTEQLPELLLVDRDAGPTGGVRTAVFGLDRDGGGVRPWLRSRRVLHPLDCLVLADGRVLVLDQGPDGEPGQVLIAGADRRLRPLDLGAGLVDPCQFCRGPDGAIFIVDRSADPLSAGGAGGTGAVFRLGPELDRLELVCSGPPLVAPAALLQRDGELFLLDADAYRQLPYHIDNHEGAIFRLDFERPPAGQLAGLVDPIRLKGLLSPLDLLPGPEGKFLIVDVNADPVERTRARGGVYLVGASGQAELFCQHPDFRDPPSGLLYGGALLLVDANADPLGLGDDGRGAHFAGVGRGAVYRVDLQTRQATVFCADPMFRNPVRLRIGR